MEELSQALRAYADECDSQNTAQVYLDLADAFLDSDFLEFFRTLDNSNEIAKVEEHFNQQNKQISVFNMSGYSAYLYDIHTQYVLYRLDRKKAGIGKARQDVREIENRIKTAESNIENIEKISGILSGTEMLEAYAKDFNKEAIEHNRNARHWLGCLILLGVGWIILTATLLCVQLPDFNLLEQVIADDIKGGTELPRVITLAIKFGILAIYTQVLLFAKKNYYAERHLEQANIHRRNVLKSLHAVYNVVNNKEERDRLLVIGATTAFSEPESGFITRKEGAGSDNSSIDAILKTLVK